MAIQTIVLRGEGSLEAVPPAGVQGAKRPLGSGGEAPPPRTWSIDAFCVMVKAFS